MENESDVMKRIRGNTQDSKPPTPNHELSPLSEKHSHPNWDLYINELGLNVNNENFLANFHNQLKAAKSNQKEIIDLLAQVLVQKNADIDVLFEELTKYLNTTLIYNLLSAFDGIIASEKKSVHEEFKGFSQNNIIPAKQSDTLSLSQTDNSYVKLTKTTIDPNDNTKTVIIDDTTTNINDNLKQTSLQACAVKYSAKLREFLWSKDILGTTLNISHTKGRTNELKQVCTQHYLVEKKLLINNNSIVVSSQAFLDAIVAISKRYISHAAQESHPANMDSIPEGVVNGTNARVVAILEEYYSTPNHTEVGFVKFSLLDEENEIEHDFEVPYRIVIEFFKALNSEQLDHAILEGAIIFLGKDPKKYLFNHEQLREDFRNLVNSDKILLQFISTLPNHLKEAAQLQVAAINRKSAVLVDEKIAAITRNETPRMLLLNEIAGILAEWNDGKKNTTNFKNLQTLIRNLIGLHKESDEKLALLNEIASSTIEKFIPSEEKFLRALTELTSEKELYNSINTSLWKLSKTNTSETITTVSIPTQTSSQSESIENGSKEFAQHCQEMVTTLHSYRNKKIANTWRSRINNPNFISMIERIPLISIKKKLSEEDKAIISKVTEFKLEMLNSFSNPALGSAIYNVFVESVVTPQLLQYLDSYLNKNLKFNDDQDNHQLKNIFRTAKLETVKKVIKYLHKKQLDKLLNLKDEPLVGIQVYKLLWSSIPFSLQQAETFINCISRQQIDEINKISPLGPKLREALAGNPFIPPKDIEIIITSLQDRNLKMLERCVTSGLGMSFYNAILQLVTPNENDQKIIEKVISELSGITKEIKKEISSFIKEYPTCEVTQKLQHELNKNKFLKKNKIQGDITYLILKTFLQLADSNLQEQRHQNEINAYNHIKNKLEEIDQKTKDRIYELLSKYSNQDVVASFKRVLDDKDMKYPIMHRGDFIHILTTLQNYNQIEKAGELVKEEESLEEKLRTFGSLGETIYSFLIECVFMSPLITDFITTLQKSIRSRKNGQQLTENNTNYLVNVFQKFISCSEKDFIILEKLFGDRYKDFLTLSSFPELGKILYETFSGNKPIFSGKDCEIFSKFICNSSWKDLKLSDQNFAKIVLMKLQSSFIKKRDLIKIVQVPFNGNIENYNTISNSKFGEMLYVALNEFNLREIFTYDKKQQIIMWIQRHTPNFVIDGILKLFSKGKENNEEEAFISVEQLPRMIKGIARQPDENLMRTLQGLFFDMPLPEGLQKFLKNIFQQLAEKLRNLNQHFYIELEATLYSTNILLELLNIARQHFSEMESFEGGEIAIALQRKLPLLEKTFRELNGLFKSKDFFDAFGKLVKDSETNLLIQLVGLIKSGVLHNNYQSFILLILFQHFQPNANDFKEIINNYIKVARIALEAFTYMALTALTMPKDQWGKLKQATWKDLDKNEWPEFLVNEQAPDLQQLIIAVARLGLDPVDGSDDQENPQKKLYPELLLDLFRRMCGLHNGKFSIQNPLHRTLLKHCCTRSHSKKKNAELYTNNNNENNNNNFHAPSLPVQKKVQKSEKFSESINTNRIILSSKIAQITISKIKNSHDANQESLSWALKIAVGAGDVESASAIINHCFGFQLVDSPLIREVFVNYPVKLAADKLLMAIKKNDVDQIVKILKTAGKFDFTALASQNDKGETNPLYIAYNIDRNFDVTKESEYPILRRLLNFLVEKHEPFPVLQLYSILFSSVSLMSLPRLFNLIISSLRDLQCFKINKKSSPKSSSKLESGSGNMETKSSSKKSSKSTRNHTSSSEDASASGTHEGSRSGFSSSSDKSHNKLATRTNKSVRQKRLEAFQNYLKIGPIDSEVEWGFLNKDSAALFLTDYLEWLIKVRKDKKMQQKEDSMESQVKQNDLDENQNQPLAKVETIEQQSLIIKPLTESNRLAASIINVLKSISNLLRIAEIIEKIQECFYFAIFNPSEQGILNKFFKEQVPSILSSLFVENSLNQSQAGRILAMAYNLDETYVINDLKARIEGSNVEDKQLHQVLIGAVKQLDLGKKKYFINMLMPVLKEKKDKDSNACFTQVFTYYENALVTSLVAKKNTSSRNIKSISIQDDLQQMLNGVKTIDAHNVMMAFNENSEKFIELLKEYSQDFYNDKASPARLVDFFKVIFDTKVTFPMTSRLVISVFIEDLEKASRVTPIFGTGTESICADIQNKILNPYYESSYEKHENANVSTSLKLN